MLPPPLNSTSGGPRHHFRCTALSCRYVTVRGLVLQRSCRVIVDKSSTNP
jgi:hypothetical protein